jgi:hypothetical protein
MTVPVVEVAVAVVMGVAVMINDGLCSVTAKKTSTATATATSTVTATVATGLAPE